MINEGLILLEIVFVSVLLLLEFVFDLLEFVFGLLEFVFVSVLLPFGEACISTALLQNRNLSLLCCCFSDSISLLDFSRAKRTAFFALALE